MKQKAYNLLRWSEKYTKTDMIYLAKGGFWLNFNLLITSILSFLLYIAFARFLPKESYGTYQFILSVGTILGAITLTGMNTAITQAVARGYEGSYKKSIWIQIKYGMLPFIGSLFIALYYYLHSNNDIALGVVLTGTFTPVINALNTYIAYLNGKKEFRANFNFAQILNFTYYPILFLSLFLTDNPITMVALNLITTVLVTFFIYFLVLKKYPPNEVADEKTIPYGRNLSLSNVVGLIALQLDNILVFHYIGAAELAIYAFATNIPDRLNGFIKSITTAALPKFATGRPEELKSELTGKTLKFTLVTLIGAVCFYFLAPFLYSTFFPQYVDSVNLSRVFFFILVLSALTAIPYTYLLAAGDSRSIYLYNVIYPPTSMLLMIVFVQHYGLVGILITKAISAIISYLLLLSIIFLKKPKTI